MAGSAAGSQVLQSKLALLKHCIAKLALDDAKKEKCPAQLMERVNELIAILVTYFQGFYMEDYRYKTNQENISPVDL